MITRPTEESWNGLDEILNNKKIVSQKTIMLLLVVLFALVTLLFYLLNLVFFNL